MVQESVFHVVSREVFYKLYNAAQHLSLMIKRYLKRFLDTNTVLNLVNFFLASDGRLLVC